MILKNLFRRKTRSALTIVGIAIGVAAVVALGAMAEGIITSYSKLLTSSGADLILSQSDAADLLLSASAWTPASSPSVISRSRRESPSGANARCSWARRLPGT
ncbi:MAG: ABC transporter permease [Chloroflexi bacterium]|nr:ABC transporter permease [Chloroflexota bacterium]